MKHSFLLIIFLLLFSFDSFQVSATLRSLKGQNNSFCLNSDTETSNSNSIFSNIDFNIRVLILEKELSEIIKFNYRLSCVDSDGDGVCDEQEDSDETDSMDACDYLSSSQNLFNITNVWRGLDCDEDGLTNGYELDLGLNPRNKDSDGDGVIDGVVNNGGIYANDYSDVFVDDYNILALDDQYDVLSGVATRLDVLSNDSNISESISLYIREYPSQGFISLDDENNLVYMSNIKFSGSDKFVYEICDTIGRCSKAEVVIDLKLRLIIPSGFSPNGDGHNDFFEILNLELYQNSDFKIYDKFGRICFHEYPFENKWRGNSNYSSIYGNGVLPQGTYYYVLDIEGEIFKGYLFINY